MNTKSLAASGLAAIMIGGSLVGASALLAAADPAPSAEVQVVEPTPIGSPVDATVTVDPTTPIAPPGPVPADEGGLLASSMSRDQDEHSQGDEEDDEDQDDDEYDEYGEDDDDGN